MLDLDSIKKMLAKWSYLGVSRIDDCAIVYGPDGDPLKKKWFHVLFEAPGEQKALEFIQTNPALEGTAYSEVLKMINGVRLYRAKLNLYGALYKKGEYRSFLEPWNIAHANIENPEIVQKFGGIIIGSAQLPGESQHHFIERKDKTIIAVDANSLELVELWPCTETMLANQINTFDRHFDAI